MLITLAPGQSPSLLGAPALSPVPYPQFMRVPSAVPPSVVFNVLLTEWHLPVPNLVVSLEGEERPLAMKTRLRDVLRHGLVKAAQSTGVPQSVPSAASSMAQQDHHRNLGFTKQLGQTPLTIVPPSVHPSICPSEFLGALRNHSWGPER